MIRAVEVRSGSSCRGTIDPSLGSVHKLSPWKPSAHSYSLSDRIPRIIPAFSSGTTSASMPSFIDPSSNFVVTQPSTLTVGPSAVSRESLYVRRRGAATILLYTSLLMRLMVAPVSTKALTQASAVNPKGASGTWHTPTNSNDVSVWHRVLDTCWTPPWQGVGVAGKVTRCVVGSGGHLRSRGLLERAAKRSAPTTCLLVHEVGRDETSMVSIQCPGPQ